MQKIILVGKPNVGKSSLFNRLAGRRIAITSDVSGTTRDTNKTIIEIYEEHGLEPLIITGDKDELQLATDMTKVIITKKGMTRFDIYDRQTIIEKYGFTPSEFIDFKGLMGDKSDNIPGIPGMGEKTARKLILKYGCVENLIEHLDELPGGKVKSSIEDNEQQALMSKCLATINVNVPVTFDIENCRLTEPDYAELIGIYKKLEFNSFLKKLDAAKVKAQTVNADAGNEAPAIKERYLINTETELDKFGKALKSERIVFLKTFGNKDHKKTPIIYGISIMANKKFFFIDCSDRRVLNKAVSILDEQKHEFAGHDLKDDYYALMRNGMTQFNTAFDTAVGQYVLDSSRSGYDIKTLAFDYSGINIDNENDYFKDRGQMDLFADPSSDLAAYREQWCIAAAAVTPHIKHGHPGDVAGQQVRGELDARVRALHAGRQGACQRRLVRSRRVLQQQMFLGQHGRQRQPDDLLLAQQGQADVLDDHGEGLGEPGRVLLGQSHGGWSFRSLGRLGAAGRIGEGRMGKPARRGTAYCCVQVIEYDGDT